MTNEEALEWLTKKSLNDNPKKRDEALKMAIEALKERKTGKWHYYRCSECKYVCTYFLRGSYIIDIEKRPNYCPFCGAKMKEEQNNDD